MLIELRCFRLMKDESTSEDLSPYERRKQRDTKTNIVTIIATWEMTPTIFTNSRMR